MKKKEKIQARALMKKNRFPFHAFVSLILLFCLYGCKTHPPYEGPPPMDTGRGWTLGQSAGNEALLEKWWESFNDPVLTGLLQKGRNSNLDIRQAVIAIEEARAIVASATGGYYPGLNMDTGISRNRQSKNASVLFDLIPGLDRNQTLYEAALGTSWEIDLFGRVRYNVDRAEALFEKAMEDAQAVRISISAEIGATYFTLRSAQLELEAGKANIAALREILSLVDRRILAGDIPETEKRAAEARLGAAEAELPAIAARIRASALALGTLMGSLPETELRLVGGRIPEWRFPVIPAGQRADILRRRPDIGSAERLLAAASAEHGLAVAEQFPKLNITAMGGFQSLAFHTLPQNTSQIFSIGPVISWNIFRGGAIRAQIHAAEARQKQAALAYEKTVLTAIEEAERSMGNYLHALESLGRQEHALTMAKEVLESRKRRFSEGDADMLDVLEAQRDVASLEAAKARAKGQAALYCVASFKALGGGWTPD